MDDDQSVYNRQFGEIVKINFPYQQEVDQMVIRANQFRDDSDV